ncbi:hypothetical protein DPMN_054337 [Dreissena polymorpha]|uniref:Uncharacterized protein n=1 Tax=Dreissena polymorpha TaxID=45954 RepID=A0A9D4HT00_DREPO|nr:hypothetical protein DPMN_054337 [Dreissena polymorpha]
MIGKTTKNSHVCSMNRKNCKLKESQLYDDKAKHLIFTVLSSKTATAPCSNFHDRAKNVTSIVFTRKSAPTSASMLLRRKTAQPLGGNDFQWTRTNFNLSQLFIRINVLSNFYYLIFMNQANVLTKSEYDWAINVASKCAQSKW